MAIEEVLGGGAGDDSSSGSGDKANAMDQLDDGALVEKRNVWIKKMQQISGSPKVAKNKKKKTTPKAEISQPDSLVLDDETAKDIGSHSLVQMLQKVLVSFGEIKAGPF